MKLNFIKTYLHAKHDLKGLGTPQTHEDRRIQAELMKTMATIRHGTYAAVLVAVAGGLTWWSLPEKRTPHAYQPAPTLDAPDTNAAHSNPEDDIQKLRESYDPRNRSTFVEAFKKGFKVTNEADARSSFFKYAESDLPTVFAVTEVITKGDSFPTYIPTRPQTGEKLYELPGNLQLSGNVIVTDYRVDPETKKIAIVAKDGSRYAGIQKKRHIKVTIIAAGIREWKEDRTFDIAVNYQISQDGTLQYFSNELLNPPTP